MLRNEEIAAAMMRETPMVLASNSPRRRHLLRQLGLPFEVRPVHVDERILPNESPDVFAVRVAEEKARAAACHVPAGIIIAADTIVVMGDEVYGKPAGGEEALNMLRRLSGTDHRVVTGLAVLQTAEDRMISTAVSTRVWFRVLREEEMISYVNSGEPIDKAGAYGIQEKGALFVDRIEGCYFNVVGLPLSVLGQILTEQGVQIW